MYLKYNIYDTDVLIVGGGGAGVRAAISAREEGANVVLAVKGSLGHCGSTSAAFGETTMYAATPEKGDSRDGFLKDTIKAGMNLIDEKLAKVLVEEAGYRMDDLVKYGVDFIYKKNRDLFESGFAHSYPRTYLLRTRYEREILNKLVNQVKNSSIKVMEGITIVKLIVKDNEIIGALGLDTGDNITIFRAPSVVLASGGAHELFPHHPSTKDMTGDGFAMAYDAGAILTNMEFIQMGPMTTFPKKYILSAPIWRLKPILSNERNERFLEKYLPEEVTVEEIYRIAEFPFTVRTITRYMDWAIFNEIVEGRGNENKSVYLDLRHLSSEEIKRRAPYTYSALKRSGLDLTKEKVEISIGVQCFHGGPIINSDSQTTVIGLYACGEAAGGLMGPERPGGNALAECQVFGHRAGENAAKYAQNQEYKVTQSELEKQAQNLIPRMGSRVLDYDKMVIGIQGLMFNQALTNRTEAGLVNGINKVDDFKDNLKKSKGSTKEMLELYNMLTTARLILEAALNRRESRGGHYREDFTEQKLEFDKNILISKKENVMKVQINKTFYI